MDDRRLDRVQVEVAGARRGYKHVREEIAYLRRGRDRGRAIVQQREEAVSDSITTTFVRQNIIAMSNKMLSFEKEAISRSIVRRLVIYDLRKYLGKIKDVPFKVISPFKQILTFAFMLTGSMNKLHKLIKQKIKNNR